MGNNEKAALTHGTPSTEVYKNLGVVCTPSCIWLGFSAHETTSVTAVDGVMSYVLAAADVSNLYLYLRVCIGTTCVV